MTTAELMAISSDRRASHRGKIRYRTYERAVSVAQRLNERTVLMFGRMVVYRCRYCPRFHIGHRWIRRRNDNRTHR